MRLFFAIWPDAAARAALAGLADQVAHVAGGRATGVESLHLTLEFLGQVAPERVPLVHRVAGAVRGRRLRIALDRVGCFRRARVAWAGSEGPPPSLVALQAALAARLRDGGFRVEERGYSPHVTLVRKIERPVERARIEPIEWPVAEFALVESVAGRYATLASWPLD
jgi:RNA 2',3'-cyclic 3'-phosphodiesterase